MTWVDDAALMCFRLATGMAGAAVVMLGMVISRAAWNMK